MGQVWQIEEGEAKVNKAFTLLAGALLLVCGTFGQTFTGSISGIVSDPTGALVSGVSIVVTDLDKNTRFRTISNQTGFYMVSSLTPGNYQVQAEKEGFRRFSLSGLPLTTQQKATVDVRLEIGALAESVTVTAQAQLLEASTSTLSAIVENKRILDLPLNGRNILQLATLVPEYSRHGRCRAPTQQLASVTSSTAARKTPGTFSLMALP